MDPVLFDFSTAAKVLPAHEEPETDLTQDRGALSSTIKILKWIQLGWEQ